jgi:hypothetical protein
MVGMDDLVAWLRGQLDADEQDARDLRGATWAAEGDLVTAEGRLGRRVIIADGLRGAAAEWLADHDPAAVLADVKAKRAIVDLMEDRADLAYLNPLPNGVHFGPGDESELAAQVLALLALAYANRPGYREDWRPK